MNDRNRSIREIQPAPRSRATIKQRGPGGLKVFIALLSVLTLLITALGYWTVGRVGSSLASAGNLGLSETSQGSGDQAPDGAVDILLVGSDSRTDAHGNELSREELDRLNAGEFGGEDNTDTMMLIRVPNDGSQATAISLPRDTYVHDDEFGNMKLNAVYSEHKAAYEQGLSADTAGAGGAGAQGQNADREQASPNLDVDQERAAMAAGRAGLISAVADLTGIEVDHYAEVGLLGFVLLTDAVGGVDVCLKEPVDDPMSGAQFPAGVSTLDGRDALAFVRQRYGLPRGDLDRIVRQQAYMASLVNKVLATGTLTNPSTLNKISTAVERSVIIDEDWDIMSFATQLSNLAGGNVTFTTIPVTSIDGVGDHGESVVTVDEDQVHAFMDHLLNQPGDSGDEADGSDGSDAADTAGDGENHDGADEQGRNLVEMVAEGAQLHILNAQAPTGTAAAVGAWLDEHGYTVMDVSNANEGIYTTSQIVAADANDPRAQALAEQLGIPTVTENANLEPDSIVVVVAADYNGPLNEDKLGQDDATAAVGEDFGSVVDAPEIDAGGDGPRCVH